MWSKKQHFWIYGLICGINNVFNLRNLCLVKNGWYFIMLKWDILYDCFEIFIDHMELSQNEDSVLVYGHFDRMNTRWSFRFWGTAGTQFGTPNLYLLGIPPMVLQVDDFWRVTFWWIGSLLPGVLQRISLGHPCVFLLLIVKILFFL